MGEDLEITLERRGNTLRVRAYVNNKHGFAAFACRHDYRANTVTADQILSDITSELGLSTDNLISEKPVPVRPAVLTLEMGLGANGARGVSQHEENVLQRCDLGAGGRAGPRR
jgi:hypothetical protein